MLHANRNATLDNQGDIAAYARADNGYASAIGVDMWGKKAGTITNAGDITAEAHADGGIAVALGVYNLSTYNSLYGTALLDNEGLISAAAYADGGVAQSSAAVLLGSFAANVINTGDITSIAEGGDAHAVGLIANSNGYSSLQNSGAITAQASGYGNAMASGAEITGRSENGYVSVAVLNAGEIGATAAGGASASAYGLLATAPTGNIDLVNDAYASITAQAQAGSGPAQAFGLYATGQGSTTLSNYGSIASDASSLYGDAVAYAALINGGYAGIGLLINGGDLNANASSTAGDAIATGAFVYGDVATIFNDGSTTATATSAGGEAAATGLGVYGGFSAIYSYGDVTATASSSSVDGIATAIGADTFGYTGSSVYNAADIVANASADGGVARRNGRVLDWHLHFVCHQCGHHFRGSDRGPDHRHRRVQRVGVRCDHLQRGQHQCRRRWHAGSVRRVRSHGVRCLQPGRVLQLGHRQQRIDFRFGLGDDRYLLHRRIPGGKGPGCGGRESCMGMARRRSSIPAASPPRPRQA